MGLRRRNSSNSNHPHGRALHPTKALLQANALHHPAVQAVYHRSKVTDLLPKVSPLKVTLKEGPSHQAKAHPKAMVARLTVVLLKASHQVKVHHLQVCEAQDLCLLRAVCLIQDPCLLLALVTEAHLPLVAMAAHRREVSLPKARPKGVL
jgi:hypothetical protein